jgi:predicted enzyme related to lactoylglutathione lyase
MAKLQLASVAVYVRDRKAAATWYEEKLGATIVSNDPEHWTTVRIGGRSTPEIHLCEKGEAPLAPESDLGESGILLLAPGNLKTVHKELAAKGVKFVHPPEKAPWGWFAKFLDLDGNEFWLMPTPSK